MFWNQECDIISTSIWRPGLIINHDPSKRNLFRCNNRHISFDYYTDGHQINPELKFKEIQLDDKSKEKNKLDVYLRKK